MGCVSSRRDINDIHPNIFQVMNVDESGQHVSPGQLELTESELVLYQRGKAATRWPLRCLRRYGFDAEIFSFESGRRCPTGPGIYAFRCRRAEQLFNLLQQNIQLRNLSDDIVSAANELAVPANVSSAGPPVSSRQPSDQSYLDSVNRTVLPRSQNNRFSRPSSVTSNGPASPPSASSPTPVSSESTATTAEHNNNKRVQHSYSNTVPLLEADSISGSTTQPYVNLEPTLSPTLSSSSEPYAQLNMDSESECCHVYMNVTPGDTNSAAVALVTGAQKNVFDTPPLLECDEEKEDPRHCYANLNPGEIDGTVRLFQQQQFSVQQTLVAPPVDAVRTMNYIVLDLEQTTPRTTEATSSTAAGGGGSSGIAASSAGGSLLPPESPRRASAKGYATIDFNKTVALSHSVNPCLDLDNEGSRKTRHNSTIGELAPILARHSTSLSD